MKKISKILNFLIPNVRSSTFLPYAWSSSQSSLKTKNYLTLVHSFYHSTNVTTYFLLPKFLQKEKLKTKNYIKKSDFEGI